MADKTIKSGHEVVANFLDEKSTDENLDLRTVSTIRTLFEEKKLTKTRLVRSLSALRETNDKDSTDNE